MGVGGDGTRGMNWNDFGVQEGVRPQGARGPFVTAKDWQVEREMLQFVSDEAIQILGGMGLMEDLPIERLWREARIERIWDGTSEIQRHIIARSQLRPYEK